MHVRTSAIVPAMFATLGDSGLMDYRKMKTAADTKQFDF